MNPKSKYFYWVAVAACAVLPLNGFAADVHKWMQPLKNVRGTGVGASFFGSTELELDNNVFLYSSSDIKDYDNGLRRDSKYGKMDAVGDIITKQELGIQLSKNFLKDRPTQFSYNTRFNWYGFNAIKNYEVYSFSLKQYLTLRDILRVSYHYVPEYFLRNLFDGDTGLYERGFFEKQMLVARYWHEFHARFRAHVAYAVEFFDYASHFNERDSMANTFTFGFTFPQILPMTTLKLFYEFTRSDSRGTDDLPDVDDDISYFRNAFGPSLDIQPLTKVHIKPFYAFHYKRYTTDHTSVVDPLHASRHDLLNELGVSGEYDLTENCSIFLRWAFEHNLAHTNGSASSTGRDDVLGYKAHRGSAGVTYTF